MIAHIASSDGINDLKISGTVSIKVIIAFCYCTIEDFFFLTLFFINQNGPPYQIQKKGVYTIISLFSPKYKEFMNI